MYKILNKNIFFHAIIILGLLAYSFYLLFTKSAYYPSPEFSMFDTILAENWMSHPLFMQIITGGVLLLKLVLLQLFFIRSQFFDNFNLLPSLIYLVLWIGTGGALQLSIIFFVNFFIILLLLLNSGYQLHSVKNQVFTSGFILGLLFFADISTALLLFFVIGSLMVNRFSKIRDVLLMILGFLIPLIYVFAIYLFTNQYLLPLEDHFSIQTFGFYPALHKLTVMEIVAFFVMILALLYSAATLTMIFSSRLIIMRRRLISINAMSITLFVILFITAFAYPVSLMYMLVPITVYFSILSQYKRKWIFHDIMILLVITLLCL